MTSKLTTVRSLVVDAVGFRGGRRFTLCGTPRCLVDLTGGIPNFNRDVVIETFPRHLDVHPSHDRLLVRADPGYLERALDSSPRKVRKL